MSGSYPLAYLTAERTPPTVIPRGLVTFSSQRASQTDLQRRSALHYLGTRTFPKVIHRAVRSLFTVKLADHAPVAVPNHHRLHVNRSRRGFALVRAHRSDRVTLHVNVAAADEHARTLANALTPLDSADARAAVLRIDVELDQSQMTDDLPPFSSC